MQYRFYSLFLFLLMPLTVTSGAALAETGKKPDKQAVVRGEGLYKTYCQSCHGKRGVGEPGIPNSIRQPEYFTAPPLDDSAHAWHHTDEGMVKTILGGSPRTKRMPAWKKAISEKQARDIVAYIKSLWSPRSLACQGPKHMSCK